MPKVATKPCERCGKRLPPEKRIFSTHTKVYYCADLVACNKRCGRRRRSPHVRTGESP